MSRSGELDKALLVSEVFPPQTGGSGRWLYEVYRRMPAGSVAVAAGEYAGAAEFDAEQELAIERMPLAFPTWGFFSGAGLKHYLGAYRRLAERVRRERIGVLHCGKCLPEGWLGWLMKVRRGVPYVVFVHGEELRVAGKSRQLTWMTRQVLRGARTIIANSHNTAQILAGEWRVADERVQVLHPGVNAERFVPAARDSAVRQQLGWGERPVVLTVGRLQKRKGQDTLIAALPAIRERVPDVLYAVVGDGEERQHLERLVDELGVRSHVQFRGEPKDDELVQCYQQCDLFALPNREVDGDFEGFGMVLVEAQACGKPVIAGDSGGTAETLRPGETGVIVDCRERAELARQVAELLVDRARLESMGQAARVWAAEQFDWTPLCFRAEKLLRLAPAEEHVAALAAAAAR